MPEGRQFVALWLRLTWREITTQGGRLLFYIACLALGVAAIAAVSGFSTQVEATISTQSRLLLGGDVELRDTRSLPNTALEKALGRPEVRAHVLTDRVFAMARAAGEARLVEVHAVAGDFPLEQGTLTIRPPEALVTTDALRGRIIIDSQLADSLHVETGAPVDISGTPYLVSGILLDDVSRDFTSLAVGPRVYLHRDDAVAHGLVGPSSRFRERLLLGLAPGTNLDAFTKSLETELRDAGMPGIRVTHHGVHAGSTSRPLRNLGLFLTQIALSALLLTGLGTASGLGEYLRSRLRDIAIYRALGARPVFPTAVLLGVLGFVAAAGISLGLGGGEMIRRGVLLPLVGGFLPLPLEPLPLWRGLTAGFEVALASLTAVILLCVPMVLALQSQSPAEVLRSETNPLRLQGRRVVVVFTLLASMLLLTLFIRMAPSPTVGLILFGTSAGLFGVLRILAHLQIALVSRYETRLPLVLRLPLAEVVARRQTATLSMALAAFSVFLVCLVQFIKNDLLVPLGDTRARGKPNVFLVDVQPSQKAGVLETLEHTLGHGAIISAPMVRARLTAVGKKRVMAEGTTMGTPAMEIALGPVNQGTRQRPVDEDERQRWLLREHNLTYRFDLTDGEEIVARWPRTKESDAASPQSIWDPSGRSGIMIEEVSVERRFAELIGVQLGEVLTFDIVGVEVKARVTSLRTVTWQNFRPNFFMVLHPSLLGDAPQQHLVATFMAQSADRARVQAEISRQFPNVTTVDVDAIVTRVGELTAGVAEATRFLAALLAGAALLLLVADVLATRRTRQRNYALVRCLGGRDGLLRRTLLLEFAWLGCAGGLMGVGAAVLVSRTFARLVLDMDSTLAFGPVAAMFSGYLVVHVFVGVLSCVGVLRQKPAVVLREA